MTKKTKVFPGWTKRPGINGGTTGSSWRHDASGWEIGHCGHPTALYPYGMSHPGLPGRLLMSHNGMGFTCIKAARAMVEQIAAGELAFTTDRCGPATARIHTRTASGDPIPPSEDYTGARIQGRWTPDGLQPKDAPPIAGKADQEYATRLDADRCSLQFKDGIRPRKPQAAVDDLPLFGGDRQQDLFS